MCLLLLQPAPTGGNPGTCNANMPNNSVYTRFLYVIKVSPHATFAFAVPATLAADNSGPCLPESSQQPSWFERVSSQHKPGM